MDSNILWSDQVPQRDGAKSSINDIAISPDGSKVVVAVGNRVLLYDAETGDLMESLRGHKETVHTVDFSYDGSRFASGGADNVVVIWKGNGQGLLKFTHTTSIQKMKFSPSSITLISCTEADFGIWNPDQKQVVKEKMPAKVLSVAWSTDGSTFALGLVTGLVSIRNQYGEELMKFERKCPIWCLVYIPNGVQPSKSSSSSSSNKTLETDLLAVGCWDKTLSFYRLHGAAYKLYSEKSIGYYPTALSLVGSQNNRASYMVITGSNKTAGLYSKDGVRLTDINVRDSWMWCCASNVVGDRVVTGTDFGGIDVIRLEFATVHALYKDRYAFRDNLTEIIVQQNVDRKVRIKCKDLVRKVALYKNKLAVQLTDRVCVYESNAEEASDLQYRVRKDRLKLRPANDAFGCHMLLASKDIVFCTNHVVESYSLEGVRQRVWRLEAAVKFLKVDGGPEGQETILVGLVTGALLKIILDNPFPIELWKCASAVICADLSLHRSKLAIVDASNVLTVVDVKMANVLFTTQGAQSVCFNSEVEDMICFNTDKSIFVVSGLGLTRKSDSGELETVALEPQEQFVSGQAIGFQGQRICCLHRGVMTFVDVPQGLNMLKALDSGDIRGAYGVACLGATESDWRILAIRALKANNIQVAKNAFARLKDVKFLNLIEQLERTSSASTAGPQVEESKLRVRGNVPQPKVATKANTLDSAWMAEVIAYEGQHAEAAKMYTRASKTDEAVRLLTDLKLWEDAKTTARNNGTSDVSHLTAQQAKWLQDTNNWKDAADLYVSMGNYLVAVKMVIDAAAAPENGSWKDVLIEIVRATPSENSEALYLCGDFFAQSNEDAFAREAYIKVGGISKLMQLYAKRQMWDEAAKLAEKHEGNFDVSVFLPYAEWLVAQDRYEDAMQAYKKAGRKDLAQRVLVELTKNSVTECRFKDSSYFYWLLAKESEGENSTLQAEYELKADLYYAYSSVHAFTTDPFTAHLPDTLFQVTRFIINSLGNGEMPHGISKAATLYTLAKQAMALGAFKLARSVYDRLTKLQLPPQKQDEIELDLLVVQAKHVRDNPDLLPVCYRCSSANPLLNPFTSKFAKGDVCTNCGHPFVRSFIDFGVLPLVEFVPDPSISDDEAIELIRQAPGESKLGKGGGWHEGKDAEADYMRFDGGAYDDHDEPYNGGGGPGGPDLFVRYLNSTLQKQGSNYIPVTVGADALLVMKRTEIFVCKPSSKSKRATFYRNMLPDIPIAISQPCHRFFQLEDFEFAYLSNKGCPYSRMKNVGEYLSL